MEITELVEKNSTLLRLGLSFEYNDARHRVSAHLQRNIDRSEYRDLFSPVSFHILHRFRRVFSWKRLQCLLDDATAEITGVGGKTYLVIKHPRTKIATIIDKSTREKEFVIAHDAPSLIPSSDDAKPWSCCQFLVFHSPPLARHGNLHLNSLNVFLVGCRTCDKNIYMLITNTHTHTFSLWLHEIWFLCLMLCFQQFV